jgi:LAO/AO transport system kinase
VTNAPPAIDELIQRLLAGDRRALARTISLVENATAGGREALAQLYPRTGRAHIVGITGGSGAGKSTLTGALTRELRSRSKSIGIVAIDPTSPFTHGALLGDRIRMQDLTRDPAVFLRSMATRGELGGLAPATLEVVAVLDAAGKDVILIETVGAGQDEVEVAAGAETTVLVLTPAGGDDVQAMKAGIMEVADVLVVNKADLAGADALVAQLEAMVTQASRGRLDVPVIRTIATKGAGAAELADAVQAHHEKLASSGELERMQIERARRQVLAQARTQVMERLLAADKQDGTFDALVQAVAKRELDPYEAARRLIAQVASGR